MKKFLLTISLLIFLLSANWNAASAHVLQTDRTIGAVMHIDPNDDPIAGEQASIFFELKDTTNRLTSKNCDCKIAILESGKTIYAQPIFQNNSNPSLDNASLFYTFPNPDVYQIILTGNPLSKNSFQPFKLTFNIRAEQPTDNSSTNKSQLFATNHLGYFIVGILLLLVSIVIVKRKFNSPKFTFQKPQKS